MDYVQSIGIDLFTAAFISNLHLYKGTFEDIPSFKSEMIDLIRMGQQTKQIKNNSDPEQLYECGVALATGYGAYWCFLNDKDHDLTMDFVAALRNTFQVDQSYIDQKYYREGAENRL